MAKIETKALLDDVRGRDLALLNLLLSNDKQALELFRLYVTFAIGAASAGMAGFVRDDMLLRQGRWGLLSVAALLTLGCWFCIIAMRSATVGLPGRTGEFWQWASDPRIEEGEVLATYLKQAEAAQLKNHALNETCSAAVTQAKRLGLATPIVGVAIAGISIMAQKLPSLSCQGFGF